MRATTLNLDLILASARFSLDFRSHELGLVATASSVFLGAATFRRGDDSLTDFRDHRVLTGLRLQSRTTATALLQVEATTFVGHRGGSAATAGLLVQAAAWLSLDFRSHKLGLVASAGIIFLRATALVGGVVDQSRVHGLASGGGDRGGGSGSRGRGSRLLLLAVASGAGRGGSSGAVSGAHHGHSVSGITAIGLEDGDTLGGRVNLDSGH